MRTVKSLLDEKGNEIWSTTPDAKVIEALQILAEKDVGALLVLDGEKLVGIFSERDYARKVILKGRSSKEIPVRDIMTYHVIYGHPSQTVEQCLELMTEKHVRHLPILEDDQLIGIVSIGDLVKAIIAEQKKLIARLERYILQRTSLV
ncbi:MAG TPA: CBS domain-containing protein [Anaerolineales bacterium]